MKFNEVSNLSVKELNKKAQEVRKTLFELKMKNTLGQLNNPLDIRSTRRSLAKVLTALKQKTSKE